MPNAQKRYHQYLRSDAWKLKADYAKAAADFRCQITWNGMRCRNRAAEVHHNNYRRVYQERPEDLTAVCRDCHRRLHHIARTAANENQLALPLGPPLETIDRRDDATLLPGRRPLRS
jgi:hypothetical protein